MFTVKYKVISTRVFILYDSQMKIDVYFKCHTFSLHSGQIWLLNVTENFFYWTYTYEIWPQL